MKLCGSNVLIFFIVIALSYKKVESNIVFKKNNVCEWTFEDLWNNKECIKLHMNTTSIDEDVIEIYYTMALGTRQEELEECKRMEEADCLTSLEATLSELEMCRRPPNSEVQKVYEYLKAYTTHYNFICNHSDCPFTKYALMDQREDQPLDVTEAQKVLEETCHTAMDCVTPTKEYLETLNQYNILLPGSGMIRRFNKTMVDQKARKLYEEGISYLSSEPCTVQASGIAFKTNTFSISNSLATTPPPITNLFMIIFFILKMIY